jgi:hypothetical protein
MGVVKEGAEDAVLRLVIFNIPEEEAELWVSWGLHVFKDGDGKSKGPFMEEYSQRMFEAAAENPGEDFFSALNQVDFEGRLLTMEEKLGRRLHPHDRLRITASEIHETRNHGVSSESLTVNCSSSGDSFFSVTQRKVQVGSSLVKSKSSIPKKFPLL